MTNPTSAPAPRPDENDTERAARAVLEAALDVGLVRVPATTGAPVVDYRTPTGQVAIEVKRLTARTFFEMGDGYHREENFVEDPRLTGWWAVFADRPDLSTLLPGTGHATRRHQSQPPRLKGLLDVLVEQFIVLERVGIHSPEMPLPPPYMDPDVAAALQTIAQRLGDSLYLRGTAPAGRPGHVALMLATGRERTGRPDILVDRLDQWLASPDARNLRKSLAAESAGTVRVAFLVFDGYTEPEVRSAEEQGTAFCPIRAPILPPEVDVVWVLVGPVACRYHPDDGWTARLAPPQAAA